MSEEKKRVAMRLGFVAHMQNINVEDDVIVRENHINTWGGVFERLDPDEAMLFEESLRRECKAEFTALMEKAMEVAAARGLEVVGNNPSKPDKPVR